jgi:hypothetical protein
MRMTETASKIRIVLLGMLLLVLSSSAAAKEKTVGAAAAMPSAGELRLTLRDLWTDHIFWVRNVILITKHGDAAAVKVAEEQAVQNAKDIAGSIVPYYGKEASDKIFGLFAGHLSAIKEYMTAAFAGKQEGKDAAVANLKKNADEIAVFLSSANPNWKKETLLSALVAHGGHHIAQINALAAGDFSAEAAVWHEMKKHVYTLADVLADGIVKQFPMKFAK